MSKCGFSATGTCEGCANFDNLQDECGYVVGFGPARPTTDEDEAVGKSIEELEKLNGIYLSRLSLALIKIDHLRDLLDKTRAMKGSSRYE